MANYGQQSSPKMTELCETSDFKKAQGKDISPISRVLQSIDNAVAGLEGAVQEMGVKISPLLPNSKSEGGTMDAQKMAMPAGSSSLFEDLSRFEARIKNATERLAAMSGSAEI